MSQDEIISLFVHNAYEITVSYPSYYYYYSLLKSNSKIASICIVLVDNEMKIYLIQFIGN